MNNIKKLFEIALKHTLGKEIKVFFDSKSNCIITKNEKTIEIEYKYYKYGFDMEIINKLTSILIEETASSYSV